MNHPQLKRLTKIFLAAGLMATATGVQAANWLMLQGTEPTDAAERARLWGFIQPEYQSTDGTDVAAGPWAGSDAAFNQIAPDLDTDSQFNIRRARIGVRGAAMPIDSKVNYFVLLEAGNNGITANGGGAVKVTDASITLNHVKHARVRIGQFKYPGSEEGLQAIHTFDYINFTNPTNFFLLERFFDSDGDSNAGDLTAMDANKPNGAVGAFRDMGVQIFDSFKTGDWEHSYAGMVGNGNGIARGDNNSSKDWYLYWASEWVFGGKGPRREGWKLFGWYQDGKRTLRTGVDQTKDEFDRTRWGLGTTYRRGKWRAAAEYINADGMIFNGTDGGAVAGTLNNAGTRVASFNVLPEDKGDGWYVDLGFRVHPKWELDVRYDRANRGTDTDANERRFETWTLGAQYFFNKKVRLIANYEIRDAEAPGLAGSAVPNQILADMDNRVSAQVLAVF